MIVTIVIIGFAILFVCLEIKITKSRMQAEIMHNSILKQIDYLFKRIGNIEDYSTRNLKKSTANNHAIVVTTDNIKEQLSALKEQLSGIEEDLETIKCPTPPLPEPQGYLVSEDLLKMLGSIRAEEYWGKPRNKSFV